MDFIIVLIIRYAYRLLSGSYRLKKLDSICFAVMQGHNSSILTLLILTVFISTIVGGITLAAKVIYGYTGFYNLHYKSDAIIIDERCQNKYFLQKFGDYLQMEIRVAYVGCLSAAGLGAVTLLIISVVIMCLRRKRKDNVKENKGINPDAQNTFKKDQQFQLLYPTLPQTATLFVLTSLMIVSSLVAFLRYLSYWLIADNTVCPLSLNLTIIQSLAIMNGIVFLFSIISWMLTCALVYSRHKILGKFEEESSEYYRRLIHKVMGDSPDSERGLTNNREIRRQHVNEGDMVLGQSKQNEGQQKLPDRLSNLKRVESIIYQPEMLLKMESVIERMQ